MTRDLTAVVVGAGFAGLAAARELLSQGLTEVTVLEKAGQIGGVWRDNTYPGAACDVPSSLYSYSFAPHAGWQRRYAGQAEILDYIERVARDEGLLRLVRLGTEVVSARFEESTARWEVVARDRDGATATYSADVLVAAVGQLSRPAVPTLPGDTTFDGPRFHSAQWRHDVDLRGARVAVIGTGASAIQFVPQLRKVAAQVTVFQRSAPYVVPKPDRAYRAWHHRAFARVPATQRFGRELTRLLSERLNRTLAEDTRSTRAFVAAWRLHLRHQVADPALRARLVPDYLIGCKRLLFSNDWYPALTEPNVDLVTDVIAEVTPDGLRTADGALHPADVLIYGTGFKATEFLAPMTVSGRGDLDLDKEWADGAHAYLGMTVPGFPNLFVMYGPNTNLGGSSILSMIECQTAYLGQAVRLLAQTDRPLEVRREISERFDREMQDRLGRSVWAASCSSWYRTPTGRITTNWPGLVSEYRHRTARLEPADFLPLDGSRAPGHEAQAVSS